jgi:hypothetical protein
MLGPLSITHSYCILVYRLDAASKINVPRTIQGGLIIPAAITRTGVFTYYNGDGSVASKELRHPDEVFKADSLASLASAPVTVRHPPQRKVDPSNWRQVTIGTVDGPGTKAADGVHVDASVRVQDQGVIQSVESKHLVEISAGYHCKTDKQDGFWNGPNGPESYTHIQRDIVYNHIALLPSGEGRAGSSARLHLDSNMESVEESDQTLILDTLTIPMLTPEQVTALQADRDALKTKNDALEAQVKGLDALNGQVAYLKGENERLGKELTAAKAAGPDQTKVDSLVDARVALVTEARLVLDAKDAPYVAAGKTDHQVRMEVLKKIAPHFKCDDKTPEGHVAGAYDMAISAYRTGAQGLAAIQQSTPAARAGEARTDSEDTIAKARSKNVSASLNAWQDYKPAISVK